jgi:hypothetical protein
MVTFQLQAKTNLLKKVKALNYNPDYSLTTQAFTKVHQLFPLADNGLSGNCCQGEEGKRRNPLGRRNWPANGRQCGERLLAQGQDTGYQANSEA